jgi:diguanylate cyclase (GGDEF)-like protein/PAS domain S-box-containing protein
MGDRLRVLILEDRASDAELVADALRRSGLEFDWTRVDRKSEYLAALGDKPDVVLADFKVPGFGALDALDATREQGSDVPMIIITGSLGDEIAAECIKRGASDYLLKDRLSRLGVAVEKVLERKRLREEARQAERASRESEAKFRELIEQASDGIFVTDSQGNFKLVNSRFCEMLGYSEQELLRLNVADTYVEAERGLLAQRLADLGEVKNRLFDRLILRRDGTLFPVEVSIRRLSSGMNQGIVRDITERKRADTRIRALNRVHAVLSGVNALIVRAKSREELYREACRISVEAGGFVMAWIGAVDREALKVTPVASEGDVRDFFDAAPLTLSHSLPQGQGMAWRAIREKKAAISNDIQNDPKAHMREQCRDRGINSVAILPLIVGDEGIGVLALYAEEAGFFDEEEMKLLLELAGDISFALDHIEKADKLNYLAYYDALTGLANRTLFHERVDQHLQDAGRARGKLAVVLIDVDRFKTINDTLGRHAGDEILKQTGKRLLRYCGDPGHLARISADRFAMVMPEVETEQEVARRIEEKLRGCFGEPYQVKDTELRIAAKIGIALFPSDGADADALFRNAEAALKKAKASGERYLFYTQQMTERIAERLALESKLRRALERQEFILHYQPKFDSATKLIEGVEALIRWQSPEQGLVPPMQFIPLLEETGLIFEVGAWALRQAAFDYRRWKKLGIAAPRIAVNVSAFQLRRRDFVESVRSVLGEGPGAAAIDLEITESLIMEDIRANTEKLEALRILGVNIAIDDFGTGYSSLAYLAKLPVQELKIDRSFIITMLKDPTVMTLVSTLISMAHSLKLKVVAEGVDEEGQAKELRRLGCDQLQGFLFSKPVSFDEMTALLRSKA